MIGVYLNRKETNAVNYIYYGLCSLQHRGQYGAGCAYFSDKKIQQHKGVGYASNVFSKSLLKSIKTNVAIAQITPYSSHIRLEDIQPFVCHSKLGSLSVVLSGGLENATELRETLEENGAAFTSFSQAEIIVHLIIKNYKKGIERSLSDTIQLLKGSFTLLVMTEDSLIAARDPNGIEPLCLGKIDHGWMLATESCAIESCGGEIVRDIQPGEIIIINPDGLLSFEFKDTIEKTTCAYEYVFFARPDSRIDTIYIYEARLKMGSVLARESSVPADIVMGVPDSGLWAAMGYATASHIPYTVGIIKNSYSGRTSEYSLEDQVELDFSKFNILKNNISGKRVILVDDSIIRGTTAKHLIRMLKQAGAIEVHFRVASPPLINHCRFTPDLTMLTHLITEENTFEDIKNSIGADSLAFLSRQGMLAALHGLQTSSIGFCTCCFRQT